mmetsp:Transcript_7656/g.17497  ORF Transcript_7656/g.17497 Transcript_7656/m.17497 type:complete len:282 (+) Transcript_7656:462-1307(+)
MTTRRPSRPPSDRRGRSRGVIGRLPPRLPGRLDPPAVPGLLDGGGSESKGVSADPRPPASEAPAALARAAAKPPSSSSPSSALKLASSSGPKRSRRSWAAFCSSSTSVAMSLRRCDGTCRATGLRVRTLPPGEVLTAASRALALASRESRSAFAYESPTSAPTEEYRLRLEAAAAAWLSASRSASRALRLASSATSSATRTASSRANLSAMRRPCASAACPWRSFSAAWSCSHCTASFSASSSSKLSRGVGGFAGYPTNKSATSRPSLSGNRSVPLRPRAT